MKEHPILFSTPMVRAILDGRKSQTRRVVKFPADFDGTGVYQNGQFGLKYSSTNMGGVVERLQPKWQVGDRLWVRETWAKTCISPDGVCDGEGCDYCSLDYLADDPTAKYPGDWPNNTPAYLYPPRWKPSIFMPRAASRILLEITSLKAERLNDISHADAVAEGIDSFRPVPGDGPPQTAYRLYGNNIAYVLNPVHSYQTLWDSIHGAGAFDTNPYVWVITFNRIQP